METRIRKQHFEFVGLMTVSHLMSNTKLNLTHAGNISMINSNIVNKLPN